MARSTPVLKALDSIVTLSTEAMMKSETRVSSPAARYAKTKPTFSDAIALALIPHDFRGLRREERLNGELLRAKILASIG
jgi:hypothetical protein